MRHARWLTREGRELWSWWVFMLPAQFIHCLLVASLGHVRPRLLNDVLSDYWCVHVDYHYQRLVAVVQLPQNLGQLFMLLISSSVTG